MAIALFAGTLLVLAGFAAHHGYMQLHRVIGVALIGGFLGDQIYFWLGKRHGRWVMARFPGLVPVCGRANELIARYHEMLIVGVRFLYGLRTVGPMALGMSPVKVWRFMLFNALGAAIWATGIGCAGYLFGQALEVPQKIPSIGSCKMSLHGVSRRRNPSPCSSMTSRAGCGVRCLSR